MTNAMLLNVIETAIREESESVRGLTITADSLLVDELGLDSLDLAAIVLKLEDQLQVPIGVQEIRNFQSVSDIMAQVRRLQGAPVAA